NYLIIYVYDEAGSPIGMLCRTTSLPENMVHKYFFTKNLQGDIIGIVNNSSYSGIAQYNPFRYRGYYFDEESGYYYLNSRYYDPQTKRFLNSNDIGVITATPEGLTDKNLYAYCDNNPVMRSDTGGEFWNWIVGAVVGAVVGFVGQVISDVITSAINGEITISNWQTYTGAVVGGAVGGAIL
ncbi:MAG: RHS repeat-associated core domain-containing protein, partial [Clostridia bacterium]|nr:RHS repeat-associated core domain-containing protein [Clostridia bacterium]